QRDMVNNWRFAQSLRYTDAIAFQGVCPTPVTQRSGASRSALSGGWRIPVGVPWRFLPSQKYVSYTDPRIVSGFVAPASARVLHAAVPARTLLLRHRTHSARPGRRTGCGHPGRTFLAPFAAVAGGTFPSATC